VRTSRIVGDWEAVRELRVPRPTGEGRLEARGETFEGKQSEASVRPYDDRQSANYSERRPIAD